MNDAAEHRPILKNNQTTYHPPFGFVPETGKEFPKTGFVFTVNRLSLHGFHSYRSLFQLLFKAELILWSSANSIEKFLAPKTILKTEWLIMS